MTEGVDVLLQYGLLGVFAAYMVRKETLWDADKKALTTKYEDLLKEAIKEAEAMKAALNDLREQVSSMKGCGMRP